MVRPRKRTGYPPRKSEREYKRDIAKLEEERDKLAKWIWTFTDTEDPSQNHLDCIRCVPHSDQVKEGFTCAKHQAADIHWKNADSVSRDEMENARKLMGHE